MMDEGDDGWGNDQDLPLSPTALNRQQSEGECQWCDGAGCDECGNTGRAVNDRGKSEAAPESEPCDVCNGTDDSCEECNGTGFKAVVISMKDAPPGKDHMLSDLAELAACGYGAQEAAMSDTDHLAYRVSVPIRDLQLGDEVCRAWALPPSKLLVLDFTFGYGYWQNDKKQNKVLIGTANKFEDTPDPWKLRWTLEDLISATFFSGGEVAKGNVAVEKRPYDPTIATEMSELSQCSFEVALQALIQYKTQEKAMQVLLSPDKKKALIAEVAKQTKEKDAKRMAEEKKHGAFTPRICPTCTLANKPGALRCEACGNTLVAKNFTASAARPWKETVGDPELGTKFPALEAFLFKYNALLRLVKVLEARLKSINERCLLCHRDLEWIGMKPSICKRRLCQLGNEGFGLAFDLAQELRDAPEVVDLLITMAYCATIDNGGSCMNFVTPVTLDAPDPTDHTKFVDFRKSAAECAALAAAEEKEKETQIKAGNVMRELVEGELETAYLDKVKLATVFRLIPPVREMIRVADERPVDPQTGLFKSEKPEKGQLDAFLRKIHPLMPGLVRWCIQSQRAHFRLLEPHEQMKSVITSGAHDCVQFAFIQSNPRTEAAFLANKQQVIAMNRPGSVWSWHGSPIPNWHPITRIGLKNLSNTKYMRVGAALGPGIYTAVESSVSAGSYCQAGSWPNSMWGGSIKLLALCEIINWPLKKPDVSPVIDRGSPSSKSIQECQPGHPCIRYIPSNNWWLIEDEASICTRFLFVLRSGAPNIKGDAITDIPVLMSDHGLGKGTNFATETKQEGKDSKDQAAVIKADKKAKKKR
jgi:hypothetical protein